MNHRAFVDAGYRIFGLHGINPDGSCACMDERCKAVGKHPLSSSWQHTPAWTDEQLSTFEQLGWLDSGYGVLVSNQLVVIDVDPRNGGDKGYARLLEDVPAVAGAGLIVESGRGDGGKHLYMLVPEGVSLVQQHHRYPGVDFKTSGYVVGPGSMHAAGNRYQAVVGSPHDIGEAPPELIEILRRPDYVRVKRGSGEEHDVSMGELLSMVDSIPNDYSDYDTYLSIGMAIHDASGGTDEGLEAWDQWARKSNKYNKMDIDRRWHSFGKYGGARVTAATLYKLATEAGWQEPVTFEYDGPAPPEQDDEPADAAPPKPRHMQWLETMLEPRLERVERLAAQPWLIDGVIPAQGVVSLVGGSGVGKSFVAVDMACSVASGQDWHGHSVSEPGSVVYVSAEGAGGIDKRVLAWAQAHGMDDVPALHMLLDAPIIDDQGDAQLVAETIAELARRTGASVRLVVLDTLNRVMQGEENSATAMAALMRGVETIRQRMDCAVQIIHHTGHGEQGRARGSSAFFAALDSEATITRTGEQVIQVENTKSKDSEPFAPVRLTMEQAVVQGIQDRDGGDVTSLVLRKATMMEEGVALGEMTEDESHVLSIVDEMGVAKPYEDMLREAFYELKEGQSDRQKRDAFRKAIEGRIQKKRAKRDGKSAQGRPRFLFY